ncbi:hypothetical protein ES705_11961 [subsurface metagenome]
MLLLNVTTKRITKNTDNPNEIYRFEVSKNVEYIIKNIITIKDINFTFDIVPEISLYEGFSRQISK